MIEVGRRGDLSVQILTPSDATRQMALDIMRIQGSAVADRFSYIPRQGVLDVLQADPDDEEHIEATVTNLRDLSEDEGWYWSVGLLGNRAVSFALYQARYTNGGVVHRVHLTELHTDPEAQRAKQERPLDVRLSAAVALGGLRRVRQHEEVTDDTVASLTVVRERPEDETEHPYAYYRRLTFMPTDRSARSHLGDGIYAPAWSMNTTVGQLDAALAGRVPFEIRA